MSTVNRVILVGNVGKDPEIKDAQGGGKIATFSLATKESWRNRAGDKEERTDWHNIVITSDPLVKVAEEYIKKGSKLYLEGQAVVRKYVDKQNIERFRPEVLMPPFRSALTLLDKREGGSSAGDAKSYGAAPRDDSEEIPF